VSCVLQTVRKRRDGSVYLEACGQPAVATLLEGHSPICAHHLEPYAMVQRLMARIGDDDDDAENEERGDEET
jgi:hypothetical protein